MKIMMGVMAMVMIKCSGLEKKKEKNKILKANVYLRKFKKKVYLIGALCFGDQDT